MEIELKKFVAVAVTVMVLLNVAGVASKQVPCFFIFGDHDFSGELTGVFSDNNLSIDRIPHYSTASGEEILKGVNYISPVPGIIPENGNILGGRISLMEQIQFYKITVSEIVKFLGDEIAAANHLRECVYLVRVSSNDHLNRNSVHKYYSDGGEERNADDIIQHYSEQLMIMYEFGARKVGLIRETQMGCSLIELGQNRDNSPMSMCHVFYDKLHSLVNHINSNLANAEFTLTDISDIMLNHFDPYLSILESRVNSEPQVPCYFIFGDSLADNGNNNLLITVSKADYLPYGINFPLGPTGRFCNGRTMFDLLAELLGFEHYMPPFANTTYKDILQGVNYASGSAGILDDSGAVLGAHVSMNGQIQNHEIIVSRISKILESNETAQEYLNKCLYSVEMGSNDYLNNYYLPEYYNTSSIYSVEEFAEVLIEQYSQQLMSLYDLGAKKFAVIGVGKIGCTPYAISTFGLNDSSCVTYINNASNIFNARLVTLIDELNTNLTDAQFIYVNSTGMVSDDVSPLGITVSDVGCCEVGAYGLCLALGSVCANSSEYAFWDSFHPTEALNLVTAIRSYNSSGSSDTYPMDIRTLASL